MKLSNDALFYMNTHANGTRYQGEATDKLEITWRLGRSATNCSNICNAVGDVLSFITIPAEQRTLGTYYDAAAPRKYTKVTLFNRGNDTVYVGNIFSASYPMFFPLVHVRSGHTGNYNATLYAKPAIYMSTVEPYLSIH